MTFGKGASFNKGENRKLKTLWLAKFLAVQEMSRQEAGGDFNEDDFRILEKFWLD